MNAPDKRAAPLGTGKSKRAGTTGDRPQQTCLSCGLRELCLPAGLSHEEQEMLDKFVGTRRRLSRSDTLYRTGDHFTALYAVRTGSLKTVVNGSDEQVQIGGFHLPGEIVGLDGLANDHYQSEAVAMEDSEVCVIPYDQFAEFAVDHPALQHRVHRLLSREIVRERGVMMLLGGMRADQRVAAFLLSIAERYRRLGYSGTNFILRMTREEIGSFLGLKLETVSRQLSAFHQQGLIDVKQREVLLQDMNALRRLAGSALCEPNEVPESRTSWLNLVQCQVHSDLN